MNLELELQNALSQEQSNFKPADIPLVKGLMAKHAANADDEMARLGLAPAGHAILPGQLEKRHRLVSDQT